MALTPPSLGLTTTLGLSGYALVSFWKPFILLATFVPWAWVITRVYDKHAARFFLPRRRWNLVHLVAGTVAVVAALMMPIRGEAAFWVGWLVMIVILVADLVAYAVVANRDERVPEHHHIRLSLDAYRQLREQKAAAKQQAKVALVMRGPDKQTIVAPNPETPEFEVRIAAEALYSKAVAARASQVDFGPTGQGSGAEAVYAARYLVDGIRTPGESMPAAQAIRLMDFWKSAAKLDVAERRKKQQGVVTVEHDGFKHVVRVTSVGVPGGVQMTMLFDPEQAVNRKPQELGLLENQMAELRAMVDDGKGIVLLGAMPDQGRTTTLYSLVQMHDAYTKNVQTVEVDPQWSPEGVRVNQFDPTQGAEYSTLVRSVLRRDPDVVFVAEVPDQNTAREITRADLERTRVYAGFRAESAIATVEAWVKAVGEPIQAGKGLRGVLAQRLLRRLCGNCKVAYPTTPEMLKKLGVPDKVPQLFKKGGQVLIKNKPEVCPACQGVGYLGQEAVFELFPLGTEERELVSSGNLQGLRAALKKKQLPSLQQAAIRKAIMGVTSVEEVTRITAPAAAAGTAPGAPPPAAGAAKPPAPAAPVR
ncbi:MAG TPA: ATPase, T2SS/T4P/T4SS family [Phycisphaerales bacterium]|nr:ATPase, T2SS/T4P/T4SS family [Phycisphaerales bacterium]